MPAALQARRPSTIDDGSCRASRERSRDRRPVIAF